MNFSQIQQQLNEWCASGGADEFDVELLSETWESMKSRIPSDYWPIIYDRFSLVRANLNRSQTMPQKPIMYYAQTPTITNLCRRYGDYWEKMEASDRLCIAKGLADCLLIVEAFGGDCSLKLACIEDGYEFGTEGSGTDLDGLFSESAEHVAMTDALDRLDEELDAPMAANLVIGIYSNLSFLA